MTHEEYVAHKESTICHQWHVGDLSWASAIEALVRLGYDPHDARDLLNSAATS